MLSKVTYNYRDILEYSKFLEEKIDIILKKYQLSIQELGVNIEYEISKVNFDIFQKSQGKFKICLVIQIYPSKYKSIQKAKSNFELKEYVYCLLEYKKDKSGKYIVSKTLRNLEFVDNTLLKILSRLRKQAPESFCKESITDLLKCIFKPEYLSVKKTFYGKDIKMLLFFISCAIIFIIGIANAKTVIDYFGW